MAKPEIPLKFSGGMLVRSVLELKPRLVSHYGELLEMAGNGKLARFLDGQCEEELAARLRATEGTPAEKLRELFLQWGVEIDAGLEESVAVLQAIEAAFEEKGLAVEMRRERTAERMAQCEELARSGNAKAQRLLGTSYFFGIHHEVCKEEARGWFEKSVAQGDVAGQVRLGLCCLHGIGGEKSAAEAFGWFEKSAKLGNADGQYWAGVCYRDGVGVKKNEKEARGWFEKSAAQGDETAKNAIKELEEAVVAAYEKARKEREEEEKKKPPSAATLEKPFENSLGMRFVPVAGTKVLFSIWETRVRDYEVFGRATGNDGGKPSFTQTPDDPVAEVSWDDATAFCKWLTKEERRSGKIGEQEKYRLPTDAEWSVAVGLPSESGRTPSEKSGKIADVYPWGTQWPPRRGAGNYDPSLMVDKFVYTSPVGSFAANRYGLYDMGGNAWEWCEDWYDGYGLKKYRVLRGGAWNYRDRTDLSSSYRNYNFPGCRNLNFGFRCVLECRLL